MKRPKGNKKSILMKLPEIDENASGGNEGEDKQELDTKLTEDDIFAVKPLSELDTEEETKEETKDLIEQSSSTSELVSIGSSRGEETKEETKEETPPVKSKKIRSEKQLAVLAMAREKRMKNLQNKKQQTNKDEIPQKTIETDNSPNTNKHSPSPKSTSNNDFESFLSNYQKMKQFENFVLEQNRASQKVVPETKHQTKQETKHQTKQETPQTLPSERNFSSMAFNLKRRSRKGGFY